MTIANKKKEDMATPSEHDWDSISLERMEFAKNNPEIIEKLFQRDPSALETFTNFGGINATVTSVIKGSNS